MIITEYLITEKRKKEERRQWAIVIAEAVLVLAILAFVLVTLTDIGRAEGAEDRCWVLCMPDSYVTLRSGPGKNRAEFGGSQCGAEMRTGRRRTDSCT